MPEKLRDALRRLIGVGPQEIVLGNSTSYGLDLLARGLPLQAGDEVLPVGLSAAGLDRTRSPVHSPRPPRMDPRPPPPERAVGDRVAPISAPTRSLARSACPRFDPTTLPPGDGAGVASQTRHQLRRRAAHQDDTNVEDEGGDANV